jgi:hypothetical protein
LARPEETTGAWETRLPSGKIFGIAIAVVATVDGAPTMIPAVQQVSFLRVITYVRDGDRSTRTVWRAGNPGAFDWVHLRLHAVSGLGPSDADLDLVFDSARSRWSGSFHDVQVSGNVILERPRGAEPKAPIGTWKWAPSGDAQSYCLHVAMGEDGRLVVWRDVITLSGLVHYGDGVHVPERTNESYGELQLDPLAERVGDRWRFQVYDGMGGERVSGELSADGATFSGEESHFESGVSDARHGPYPFIWRRIPGVSCATTSRK